ncbi:hypothetical protein COLSTE_01568 [Collinsella stercoris DSM 13279]|uniref:Uncharacterized protein n=1 Tax=Collinsella stercoris DSM 13279 TaxID=445975 RepID=B6GBV4_9ACTN|nr:hypothetical protein COLSTE_01568 [Collinsella stercoris DSM 13279]
MFQTARAEAAAPAVGSSSSLTSMRRTAGTCCRIETKCHGWHPVFASSSVTSFAKPNLLIIYIM